MEGKELTDRILNEARAKADEIISAAEKKREDTLREAQSVLDKKRDEVLAACDEECKQIVSRRVMLAKLDANKSVLSAKQELINEVFDKAAWEIVHLSDNVYRDFVSSLVKEYAEDGDEIIISQNDRKRLDAEWFNSVAMACGKKIRLSEETHSSLGGVILRGKTYDKNLTVAALTEEVKKDAEPEIAAKLFG